MMLLPVTLCAAQFLLVLDVTIVAVALPAMRQTFALSPEALQWVITAYTLAFGGLLVATGRAGDLLGHRRLFRAGLLTFGGASLACALAPSAAALVAGRAVQGGVLTVGLGWPAVFLVNVPLCAAAALVAGRLPERRGAARSLDLAGTAAITAALALLVLGLTQVPAALAGAAAAFALFLWVERRAGEPILPGWARRRRGFARANGVAVALTATTTPAMFLAILFQQESLGRSALAAGLWCAPFNVAVIAGSLLGRRVPMAGGLAATAAGALALLTLAPAALPVAFVLMGAGLGCASVASTATGTAALGDGEQGIAAGVLNASAQIGTALGLAVIAGLSYRAGFAVTAALALGVAANLNLRRGRKLTTAG